MQDTIYIGNKPYWEESLNTPEKYARWVVMQKNDSVWKELLDNPAKQARLYTYFEKVYTSPDILIFRRQRQLTTAAENFEVRNPGLWQNQCIDTMKFSRDAARELIQRPDLNLFVAQELDLIKDSGANCVSLGTPYDEEFVPYLSVWTNAARERGLKVWFRGNMSGWEGWFDYPVFKNTKEHDQGVYNLITKHPELFRSGDIFTPAPEPENGMLGDPRSSDANKEKFFAFLPESYDNCVKAFQQIEVGVACGYFSVNGDVAKLFTKDLVSKTGNVLVIDHYVSSADKLINDIKAFHDKLEVPIMLGEFGAPIPDINGNMNEDQQAQFIGESMKKLYEIRNYVLGINYWVLRGGSTQIVNDDKDTRKAYDVLKQYFYPARLYGKIVDVFDTPQDNVTISLPTLGLQTKTNVFGEYDFVVPALVSDLKIQDARWVTVDKQNINPNPNTQLETNFQVEPVDKGLWYQIKWLWKKIHKK